MMSLPATVYSLAGDFDMVMRRVDGFVAVVGVPGVFLLTDVSGRSVGSMGEHNSRVSSGHGLVRRALLV